nr:MAG TPA: hypothetical protein [Caudoviricetes sp.]
MKLADVNYRLYTCYPFIVNKKNNRRLYIKI